MTLVCQPRALSTEHTSQSVPGGCCPECVPSCIISLEVWDQVNSFTLWWLGVASPWRLCDEAGAWEVFMASLIHATDSLGITWYLDSILKKEGDWWLHNFTSYKMSIVPRAITEGIQCHNRTQKEPFIHGTGEVIRKGFLKKNKWSTSWDEKGKQ